MKHKQKKKQQQEDTEKKPNSSGYTGTGISQLEIASPDDCDTPFPTDYTRDIGYD